MFGNSAVPGVSILIMPEVRARVTQRLPLHVQGLCEQQSKHPFYLKGQQGLAILPEVHQQIQIPRPHQEILTGGPKQGLGVELIETFPGDSGTPGRQNTAFDPTRVMQH